MPREASVPVPPEEQQIQTQELTPIIEREVVEEEKVTKIEKKGSDIIKYDNKFIVDQSPLIVDKETKKKYVTITIDEKIMHYIQEGLATYKAKFKSNSDTDRIEREEANKLVDEFNQVKNILTEEPELNEKFKKVIS